jgi:hypothetical protein
MCVYNTSNFDNQIRNRNKETKKRNLTKIVSRKDKSTNDSGFGTHVGTHTASFNFFSRHINPFLVCFPSRAWDSGVQKWFQNFDLNFFHQSQLINRFFVDFFVLGVDFDPKKFV